MAGKEKERVIEIEKKLKSISGKEKNWVIEIEENLKSILCPSKEAELRRKHSIYRVPVFVKALNSKAYTPQMVAFGPYHHHKQDLQPMEVHKTRALLTFLHRTNKPLDAYLRALEKVVQQLMDSYEDLDEEWRDKDHFLKLMMRDGCFLHELLHTSEGISDYYPDNDPIFSYHGMLYNLPCIRRDMLMIENQVPLLVLERLVKVSTGGKKNECGFLDQLILKLCTSQTLPITENLGIGLHILDVFRKSMIQGVSPKFQRSSAAAQGSTGGGSGGLVQSALEMHDAGIRFKKSGTTNIDDVDFMIHPGILQLPAITVDDATEFTFLNLLAFERLHKDAGNEVTSYIFLMDKVIDTAKDVQILRSKGIVKNALGSDEAVADLFNKISKDMPLDPYCRLKGLHQNVSNYCNKRTHRWKATLRHYYFINPWVTLSVVAAFILLALDTTQTIHSVLSYYLKD
ncbi:hypothetical protein MRB53_027781 [Persea americana]|uniref:Uncharacterized protein n=1 Tax=Persea americana TaxID=3435 RepID=A0ACC2LMB5_PERAE|nr:hypothetical protein MRB53_027781 [Persea americana]